MGPLNRIFLKKIFWDKTEIKYELIIAYIELKQKPTCISEKFDLGFDREVLVGNLYYIKSIMMKEFCYQMQSFNHTVELHTLEI